MSKTFLTGIEIAEEKSHLKKKEENIKQQKEQDLTLLTIKLSKYLRQELDGKVLNLVKQKWFYPFEYVSGLIKSCQAKESLIVYWWVKKLVIKIWNIWK